jgi:hypothetical protein
VTRCCRRRASTPPTIPPGCWHTVQASVGEAADRFSDRLLDEYLWRISESTTGRPAHVALDRAEISAWPGPVKS